MNLVTRPGATAFGLAAVTAAGLFLAAPAQAAPFAVSTLAADATVQTVAGGCGPGFHPNPWGVCRPNWGPRPTWGRPAYGPYAYYARPRPYYRPYAYGPRPFY